MRDCLLALLALTAWADLACNAHPDHPRSATVSEGIDSGGSADASTSQQDGTAHDSDAGVEIDGGESDGGNTTSSECDGRMESLPPLKTYVTDYATMNLGYCGLANADAQGNIALEVSQSHRPAWELLSSAGARIGRADAWRGALFPATAGYLVEQGNSGGANNSPNVQGVDPTGTFRNQRRVYGTPLLLPSPQGELLVLGPVSQDWVSPPAFRQMVWMLREDARSRWGPQPLATQSTVFGGGTDLDGRVLVVQDGATAYGRGSVAAQWFDHDGTVLSGTFLLVADFVARASTWFETSPILGGGLAVRRMDLDSASGLTMSEWLVVVTPGSTFPEPAPDWLRSRPNTNLIPMSGNRYSVLPWGKDSSQCTQEVEILSASGASCATVALPIDSGTCRTRDLRRGLDGTLLQMLPADREQSPIVERPDVHTCTLRFWSGALR